MNGGLDRAAYPALHLVLYGETAPPGSCDTCPLSSALAGSDGGRFKRYYLCKMAELHPKMKLFSRVLGERPQCLRIFWIDLAQKELDRILGYLQKAMVS